MSRAIHIPFAEVMPVVGTQNPAIGAGHALAQAGGELGRAVAGIGAEISEWDRRRSELQLSSAVSDLRLFHSKMSGEEQNRTDLMQIDPDAAKTDGESPTFFKTSEARLHDEFEGETARLRETVPSSMRGKFDRESGLLNQESLLMHRFHMIGLEKKAWLQDVEDSSVKMVTQTGDLKASEEKIDFAVKNNHITPAQGDAIHDKTTGAYYQTLLNRGQYAIAIQELDADPGIFRLNPALWHDYHHQAESLQLQAERRAEYDTEVQMQQLVVGGHPEAAWQFGLDREQDIPPAQRSLFRARNAERVVDSLMENGRREEARDWLKTHKKEIEPKQALALEGRIDTHVSDKTRQATAAITLALSGKPNEHAEALNKFGAMLPTAEFVQQQRAREHVNDPVPDVWDVVARRLLAVGGVLGQEDRSVVVKDNFTERFGDLRKEGEVPLEEQTGATVKPNLSKNTYDVLQSLTPANVSLSAASGVQKAFEYLVGYYGPQGTQQKNIALKAAPGWVPENGQMMLQKATALVKFVEQQETAHQSLDDTSILQKAIELAGRPVSQTKSEDNGLRLDGTPKGPGFFGTLSRPDGQVSTELSIGVEMDGKEIQIPSLVPTLDQGEINHLLAGDKPTRAIINKAVTHARQRVAAGKSPFAGPGEQVAVPDGKTGAGSKNRLDDVPFPTKLREKIEKLRAAHYSDEAIMETDDWKAFIGGKP